MRFRENRRSGNWYKIPSRFKNAQEILDYLRLDINRILIKIWNCSLLHHLTNE